MDTITYILITLLANALIAQIIILVIWNPPILGREDGIMVVVCTWLWPILLPLAGILKLYRNYKYTQYRAQTKCSESSCNNRAIDLTTDNPKRFKGMCKDCWDKSKISLDVG